MGKRRLTKQQKRRIQEKQLLQQTNAELNQFANTVEDDISLGTERTGIVVGHYGAQADIEDNQGSIHRCHLRSNLKTLVTGDNVTWREGSPDGVVVAVKERFSELCRPSLRGELKPVAANINRIVLVIAPKPEPHPNLIDRYLVAAEAQNIETLLLLNKSDLLSTDDTLTSLLNTYQELGYSTFTVSAKKNEGMTKLADYLKPLTSVFVGQSGVGKSSLLKTLAPALEIAIGELSVGAEKGTHTTTASKLFHLPAGGRVIDSPGIREFGLWHLASEKVAEGFIEFRPFLGHCKFRDCQHRNEPKCALIAAVNCGEISHERFNSYKHIVQSLEEA